MTPEVTRRSLLVGLGVGAAVLSGESAHARTTPSPSATEDSAAVRVVLLEVTPSAYSAADPERSTILVRARVENRSETALTGLTARLVAQRSASVARSALANWAEASERASITRSSASSDDVPVPDLAPGATAEVTLTLPASSLGSGIGAHLAAVEVSDEDSRVGVARTFLVSAPGAVSPTPLTLLLPLVAGRDGSTDGLAQAVTDRLGPLVAGSTDPRVAWALDPALVSPAVTNLPDWSEELLAAAPGRVVLGLPFGDPDLGALQDTAAGTDLLTRAVTAADGTFDDLTAAGARLRRDVFWPADQGADEDLLTFCAQAGATAVVLDDVCLAPDPDLTYTPTGRASTGALPAVVADSTMTSVLADLEESDLAVAVRQRLLAEVATTTQQRPGTPRPQLLVAPRSFAPAAAQLTALITDLEGSGWGVWQHLDDLLALGAPDVDRTGPELTGEIEDADLPASHVEAVEGSLRDVDDFSSALQTSEPDADLLSQQRSALLLLGASWRGHTAELPSARAALASAVLALTRGVSIAGGSVRNLAAERSELPITLVNELDVPVQVQLVLKPRTPRVQLDTIPQQTVAARSQLRVAVPVRALANGSVVVEAQLFTPAGSPIGPQVDVDLNVRADVENWISGVVGGGAAALLVVGLVRAFRRGRRRVDEAEHADLESPADPA